MDSEIWQRVEEFKRTGQVSISMEFQVDGTVYVSITRVLGEAEHYHGAYFETVEEGLESCMKAIIRMTLAEKAPHLEIIK